MTYWQGKRACLTHRIVYELVIGLIPENMCVCHKCDNPSCVNPDHLFLGTPADNNHDKVSKGRQRGAPKGYFIGCNNPSAKITIDDVVKVRALYAKGKTAAEIARLIGIPYGNTWMIVKRKTWIHI